MNDPYDYPIYKEWIDSPGLIYRFESEKIGICVQQEDNVSARQDTVFVGYRSGAMVPHHSNQWKDVLFVEKKEENIYELLKIKDPNNE